MKKIRIKKDVIKFFKLVIALYIIVHILCYFSYKPLMDIESRNKIIKGLKFTKSLNISRVPCNDYLTFHSMKIKNEFKNFVKQEDNLINYDKYYNEDKTNGLIIGMDETKITLLQNNETFFSEDRDIRINNKNISKYLKKYKIDNDIDLIRHIQSANIDSYSIFTSIKTMKERFLLSYIIDITMPEANEVYKITGDYGGYAFVLDDIMEVSITKNDKRYIYSFIGLEYFNEEYINQLLNTIVLE